MPALRSVHCIHCGQTYLTMEIEKCSLCRKSGGLVEPNSAQAQQAMQALQATLAHKEEPWAAAKPDKPADWVHTFTRILICIFGVKMALGGLIWGILGAITLFDERWESAAIGMALGLVVLGLGAVVFHAGYRL